MNSNGANKKFPQNPFEVALPQYEGLKGSGEQFKKWFITKYFFPDTNVITTLTCDFPFGVSNNGLMVRAINIYLHPDPPIRVMKDTYRFFEIEDQFDKAIFSSIPHHGRTINDRDVFIKKNSADAFFNSILNPPVA